MQLATVVTAVLALTVPAPAAGTSNDAERAAVIAVITDAYINGVHAKPDPAAMRRGFHRDFRMLVLTDNTMNVVTLDEWAGRVEKAAANPQAARPAIRAEFPQVDITGAAASVRVDLFRDGVLTFTDYLLLYRFADGWKIVSKNFHTHRR